MANSYILCAMLFFAHMSSYTAMITRMVTPNDVAFLPQSADSHSYDDTTANPTSDPTPEPTPKPTRSPTAATVNIPYIIHNGQRIPLYLPIVPTSTLPSPNTTENITDKTTENITDKTTENVSTNLTQTSDNHSLCLNPGQQCNSESFCCRNMDSFGYGHTQCKYTNDTGICCVIHEKEGCLTDSDCCNTSDVCNNLVCMRYNIEIINEIEFENGNSKGLFPKQFFFALIFVPLLIMTLFGIGYKCYNRQTRTHITKGSHCEITQRNIEIHCDNGIVLCNGGYVGNNEFVNEEQFYDENDLITNDECLDMDSDVTPIPASFSMKERLFL